MKNLKKLFVLTLLLLTIASCSKDDDKDEVTSNDEVASNDDAINQLEETILNASTVLDNLAINGATKNAGAPTPNGAISFQLENPSNSAFLKTGFSINFKETSDAFIGAYLQIKSVDGTLADGYWDISSISGKQSNTKTKRAKQTFYGKKSITGGSVTVNFLDAIQPGKFCYAICVYDASGNISLPEEVCVEVENWGGNSTITGNWGFVSEEEIENGVSDGVINVGEEYCWESYFYCTSVTPSIEILYESCDKINALDLSFNSGGTYVVNEIYEYSDIDYEASQINCVAVGENGTYSYNSEGKWAFDEEDGVLTLIEFFYDEDGESVTIPEGEVFFQGPISINNNILTITDIEIYGSDTYEWILKFSKK